AAGVALVGAVADELAVEAVEREAARARIVVGEGALAHRLGARVLDREGDRPVAADQGAVAGGAVQPRDVAAIVAVEDRGRAVGLVGQGLARHDIGAIADDYLALAVDRVILAERSELVELGVAV